MAEYRRVDNEAGAAADVDEDQEEFKIYIGRVPTKFTEDIVKRILTEKFGKDGEYVHVVEKVELIYPHDDEDENENGNKSNSTDGYRADRKSSRDTTSRSNEDKDKERDPSVEHRGFGFVAFATAEFRDAALELGTIRSGRKKTSKKLHTMYLRPYVAKTYDDEDDGNNNKDGGGGEQGTDPGRDVCYLWNLNRCPYGDDCKFKHIGEGGCIKQEKDMTPEEQKQLNRKRKGKCFTYKKKGKCSKGDECPFSHDFVPEICVTATTSKSTDGGDGETNSSTNKSTKIEVVLKSKSEKDCINWKTKGKCRKGDKCVYKHDPELQQKALEKKAKKRQREGGDKENNDDIDDNKRQRKEKQPISVRVFGLNYDTKEEDVKEFIESTSGHPVKSIVFPLWEDSNRSKGYCGVYFASPKAAKAAVETCDNGELHGRWLRVQTGKSMTIDQWEGLHHKS